MGLARSSQVVYAAAVLTLPMEWLWRAVTHRQIPAMRLSPPAA